MDTKSIHFINPESFQPSEFLRSPRLWDRFDDARYFIHLVLTKTARDFVDESGGVRLFAAYLRSVMHFRDYSHVVDALLDGGAVTRAAYHPGETSFSYRLSPRYIRDKHVRVAATDPRLIGRLEIFHARAEVERRSRMKPVHEALERQQRRLQIHGDLAREIISGLPPSSNPYDTQGILVADIEHGQFHCNVGKYGRLSNNITSMKREVRKALHHEGSPITSVDIACCQPALIAVIARERRHDHGHDHGRGTEGGGRDREEETRGNGQGEAYMMCKSAPPTRRDLAFYEDLVQSGELYEFLLSALREWGIEMSRDSMKKRFLADVVAKRKANRWGAEYPSDVEDVFRERFPTVYAVIREINRDGWEHQNLIQELQRHESRLVIETVAAELVALHPSTFFTTLHDAIYTTGEHIPKVERAFQNTFEERGFAMRLKLAA